MRFLLLPLAWLYQLGGWIRNLLFDLGLRRIRPAPLPVISVGNISFGGSGKTPLVMKLTGSLLGRGMRPAVVSRGYRGRWEDRGGIVSNGRERQGTWQDAGDEPFMLAENFPEAGVFVGKDRLASCRAAAEKGFHPAVLDDGFQHRRLARDVDIVLYDPRERTLLREPVFSLKRADIILVKDPESPGEKQKLASRFSPARVFEYSVFCQGLYSLPSRTPASLASLQEQSVLAFCGIANPRRFLDLLASEGLSPTKFLTFPDHHSYPPASIARLQQQRLASRATALVTTEKDALKLVTIPEVLEMPLYYLKIDLDIEEDFFPEVLRRLQGGSQVL